MKIVRHVLRENQELKLILAYQLVAGYFVEYSAMAFALFFLGEYSNMGRIGILSIIVLAVAANILVNV